ncbi:Spore germination protein YndE [Bacillus paralicheniformis]|nr:Spore germination protein YndE [Bacillus paralicheniformis]
METAKVSPKQLFTLIVLFEFGTALIVPLGIGAKQDAWLAELIGMIGGTVLFFHYYYLYKQYPKLLPTRYFQKILGKHLGFLIGLSYVLFFIYGASRDLRDSSELLLLQYNQTPMYIVSGITMLLVCYALYKGIEVLARTAELIFPLLLFLIILTFVFLAASNVIRFENLLPVLENGWEPVVTTAFLERVFFPYGELVCFTVIFPYINRSRNGMKFGLTAMIFAGFVLIMTIVLEIAVLGVYGWSTSTFSFLRFVEKINIGGFIQGLQGFAMIVLVVGNFFKVAIFSYAAIICSADLFNLKHHASLIAPIGFIILTVSMASAASYVEHIEQAKIVLRSIFVLFEFIIPFLLTAVVMVKKHFGGSTRHS